MILTCQLRHYLICFQIVKDNKENENVICFQVVVNAVDELALEANQAEVNYNQLIAYHNENEVSVQAHTPWTLYNEKRNQI